MVWLSLSSARPPVPELVRCSVFFHPPRSPQAGREVGRGWRLPLANSVVLFSPGIGESGVSESLARHVNRAHGTLGLPLYPVGSQQNPWRWGQSTGRAADKGDRRGSCPSAGPALGPSPLAHPPSGWEASAATDCSYFAGEDTGA